MREITMRMIALARQDIKPLSAMGLKAAEELGELSEAINHHEGYLPHKTMKEPLAGEVADVINCVITVLVKAHPEFDDYQIYDLLNQQLVAKANKWEAVIHQAKVK